MIREHDMVIFNVHKGEFSLLVNTIVFNTITCLLKFLTLKADEVMNDKHSEMSCEANIN